MKRFGVNKNGQWGWYDENEPAPFTRTAWLCHNGHRILAFENKPTECPTCGSGSVQLESLGRPGAPPPNARDRRTRGRCPLGHEVFACAGCPLPKTCPTCSAPMPALTTG